MHLSILMGCDCTQLPEKKPLRLKAFFESLEGIDILPPSTVAVASLLKSVKTGNVRTEDIILLNIAGGGYMRLKEDFTLFQISPVAHAKNPDVPLEYLNI